MDFLNKVGESLTSFGNGMSARTKNMMDQSNLNSQLRQHENTLKGLYETIGRQYYAEKQGKGEGEYAEIFEQVAGVEALTDELRKKIEIAKSMVPCPKCGGRLVIRRTKKGRRFYACENTKTCDYISWNKPKK